ncbi:hypothetical protein GCM10010116_30000 [Microbispora rosea subsp. aerata]|nr:hypothetical protein GCM10010116_30000 [Microbispora rosea subsp. aerata]GLJ86544.1 hypothetical protein GCM10017588_52820 [Microbispora rosea subsp. aerata]
MVSCSPALSRACGRVRAGASGRPGGRTFLCSPIPSLVEGRVLVWAGTPGGDRHDGDGQHPGGLRRPPVGLLGRALLQAVAQDRRQRGGGTAQGDGDDGGGGDGGA